MAEWPDKQGIPTNAYLTNTITTDLRIHEKKGLNRRLFVYFESYLKIIGNCDVFFQDD